MRGRLGLDRADVGLQECPGIPVAISPGEGAAACARMELMLGTVRGNRSKEKVVSHCGYCEPKGKTKVTWPQVNKVGEHGAQC